MKKINIIKKSNDFTRIIKAKKGISNNLFILNQEANELNIPKFGITFVKKIGNAVTRNKLKRQVKSIIDNNKDIYEKNKNYIIIIRKDATRATYKELETNLVNLFLKLKGDKNEKK